MRTENELVEASRRSVRFFHELSCPAKIERASRAGRSAGVGASPLARSPGGAHLRLFGGKKSLRTRILTTTSPSINRNTTMGSGGNEKLPPVGFLL